MLFILNSQFSILNYPEILRRYKIFYPKLLPETKPYFSFPLTFKYLSLGVISERNLFDSEEKWKSE